MGHREAEEKMVRQWFSVAVGNAAWEGRGDRHLGSGPGLPWRGHGPSHRGGDLVGVG